MPMAYWDAVKLYNYEGKFEEYCNPRKNSPEYYEVLKIASSNKQPLPEKLNKKKRNGKKKVAMVSVGTQAGGNNTIKVVGRPTAPPSSDPKIMARRKKAQDARDAKNSRKNAGN